MSAEEQATKDPRLGPAQVNALRIAHKAGSGGVSAEEVAERMREPVAAASRRLGRLVEIGCLSDRRMVATGLRFFFFRSWTSRPRRSGPPPVARPAPPVPPRLAGEWERIGDAAIVLLAALHEAHPRPVPLALVVENEPALRSAAVAEALAALRRDGLATVGRGAGGGWEATFARMPRHGASTIDASTLAEAAFVRRAAWLLGDLSRRVEGGAAPPRTA